MSFGANPTKVVERTVGFVEQNSGKQMLLSTRVFHKHGVTRNYMPVVYSGVDDTAMGKLWINAAFLDKDSLNALRDGHTVRFWISNGKSDAVIVDLPFHLSGSSKALNSLPCVK